MTGTVDDLLKKFGDPGRYQLVVFALMLTVMFSIAFNNFASIFLVRYFPHRCKLPSDWSWSINESIPIKPSGEYESCSMYVDPSNHTLGTTTCLYGWEHQPALSNEWTIVQEWDLVCDRYYLSALATSLYFAGVMVGSLFAGYLSDKFGRKPVMLVSMYIQIAIGITLSFSVNYTMYVILRFAHGFILQGTFATAYALSVELFLPHRRSAVAISAQILWPVSLLTTTGLSYWLGHWRHLHLAISLPALVSITYYWFVPESPRWLLSVHRTKKALFELSRLARRNNIPVPPDLENEIVQLTWKTKNREQRQVFGIKDLFRKKRLRMIVAITCFMQFVGVVNFYGIAFSFPNIGKNIYVNFAIGTTFELAISCVMYFVLVRFGRKQISMGCMFMCSFFMLLTFVFQIVTWFMEVESLSLPIIVMAFIGRAAIAAYYCVMPIFTNELFPTVLRTLGIGCTNFSGRLGGMIAPLILLLDRYVWKPLPFLIFTLNALLAASLTFFLPETRNKPLPEFPDDIDLLWDRKENKAKKQALNGTEEEKRRLPYESNEHNETRDS